MFGALGGISFEVLGGPTELHISDASHYAKLKVLGTAPLLQWLYDELTEIVMTIFFHQLWCDPIEQIQILQDFRQSHSAAPLVVGAENRGNFVIESIEEQDTWRADDGTLIACTLKMVLIQWTGQLPVGAPTQRTTGGNYGIIGAPPGTALLLSVLPVQMGVSGPYSSVPLSFITRLF
jgi:phage protein U